MVELILEGSHSGWGTSWIGGVLWLTGLVELPISERVHLLADWVKNDSSDEEGEDILTYAPAPIASTAIAPSRIVVFLFIGKEKSKEIPYILKKEYIILLVFFFCQVFVDFSISCVL